MHRPVSVETQKWVFAVVSTIKNLPNFHEEIHNLPFFSEWQAFVKKSLKLKLNIWGHRFQWEILITKFKSCQVFVR